MTDTSSPKPYRRSKRQLYIGLVFIILAILVAMARTLSNSAATTPDDTTRIKEHIGITLDQAVERLGEPTSRAEFYPDEDFNPDRAATIERIKNEGETMPEVFLELAWFSTEDMLAIRFPGAFDDNGSVQPAGVSIDAVRRTLTDPADTVTPE